MNRRDFLKLSATAATATQLPGLAFAGIGDSSRPQSQASVRNNTTAAEYDVFVYGSTPSGVGAAFYAAREGCRVLLACPKKHAGGMLASGLGVIDTRHGNKMHGDYVSAFCDAVAAVYQRRKDSGAPEWALKTPKQGVEPSVAEKVFDDFLSSQGDRITHWRGYHLLAAESADGRMLNVTLESPKGMRGTITARTFVDCTYEGDLAAAAGVPYRVGREAGDEFGESLAGIRYIDWRTGAEHRVAESGSASRGIQAYCARCIFTTDRKKMVPVRRPANYEQHLMDLMPLGRDFESGRLQMRTYGKELANHKWELNGSINQPTSLNCPGVNWDWPEADRALRARLERYHVEHAASFVWFLQRDKSVPDNVRNYWRRAGLHADEFADNGHWPWQIYVREARRIEGRARVTQHNFVLDPKLGRTPPVPHAIAIGEYAFDVHPCRDRRHEIDGLQEGAIWYPHKVPTAARPGQIPYEAMLPKNLDNLLVPVALSATHIGMAVVRMEPVWMTTGQISGLAAAEAKNTGRDVAHIDPALLPPRAKLAIHRLG